MNASILKVTTAAVLVVGLCQCQSEFTPRYRTLETKLVTYGGRQFFQETRVVCEHPLETQVLVTPR